MSLVYGLNVLRTEGDDAVVGDFLLLNHLLGFFS
jgi:hypothetical protein